MHRHAVPIKCAAPNAILKACGVALIVALVVFAPVAAAAQQQAPPPAPQDPQKPAEEPKSTGLPAASGLDWKFNLDASWGNFGFMNSLYTNPKPEQPSGNLGDNWFEGAVKPAITATYTTPSSWQVWGKLSVVGERTYGAAPTLVGDDASSFKPDDLAVGIKSGKALENLGDDALQVTVGRARYRLGHGFLLWDGASEGGTRGGYWTNARQAFDFASIVSLNTGPHKAEAFYLLRDELPEVDSHTRLLGFNYEATLAKVNTLGVTYMKFWANSLRPARDMMNVFNVRAYTAPFGGVPDLSFEFEYARESNGQLRDSNAWTLQGAYEFSDVKWKPKLSYRYAFFQGDNPDTANDESWDPLLLGFSDWGTWWQGEIAGEYFLSNSNLQSHMVRLHLAPNKKLGTGAIFWDFRADQPGAYGPNVTAKDIATEVDWYADWKLNGNFTLSFVAAFGNPGTVVKQVDGHTANFGYAMAFVAYSY
jgi:hypothetical protein